MKNDFVLAISQLSAEKNLDSRKVFEAVEAAMASAFKKDELQYAAIEVKIDIETGDIAATRVWNVIEDDEIEDDEIEVSPERAAEMGHPGKVVGDVIRESIEATPDTGRIAAQTAKQVVLQRLREAERDVVFEEFTGKQGELVSGTVLRVEPGRRQVILDLGRTEAAMPFAEQVRAEHYRVGQRLRVFVKEVYKASKGPQVVVSRAHSDLLRRIFELEIPEIARGVVEIMGMAREPGQRTKVALISRQEGVDPIGAAVGIRGSRIQNIVNELGGERIDLIRWDPNELAYIANALSPAEVVSIRLDEEANTAYIAVPDKQLSLAIGKDGQNARLAAKLTHRRIEIQPESVLIHKGEDLYPPPEPNMEAIELEDRPGVPALAAVELPEEVAPSQAEYARPGLPCERPPPAPAPVAAEAAPLTPEQEVLAEFGEDAEPAAEPAAVEPAAAIEEPPAAAAAPPAASGIRFAEEIGGLRREEDETEETTPQRGRRRPTRGAARGPARGPARSERARAAQRPSRRFEVADEEIEEGLSELHGGVDEDDYEDADSERGDSEDSDDYEDVDSGRGDSEDSDDDEEQDEQ